MSLEPCRECGQKISSEARVCPICGIKSPVVKEKKTSTVRATIKILAVLCFLPLGFFIAAKVLSYHGGELPLCDSSEGQAEVNSAIANAPIGRTLGISVVKYKNIKTESSTPTEIHCKADAELNNSLTKSVSYSFTDEDNQVMVRFQFDLLQ
jgi:hypothetical protein